jgi:hypothetical protein
VPAGRPSLPQLAPNACPAFRGFVSSCFRADSPQFILLLGHIDIGFMFFGQQRRGDPESNMMGLWGAWGAGKPVQGTYGRCEAAAEN